MVANYLHGPETIEVENRIRPARTMRSVVIDLTDTTPMGDVDTLVQYLSERDTAAFGSQFTGFTILQALDAVYDHGAGTVLVISVLDPAKHKTAIKDGVVISDKSTGQIRLAYPVVANVVVKNSKDSITHMADTDYRVDVQADVLMNLGKAIEAGGNAKMSYEYADPSKMTAANIIDGMNSAGNQTGMKLLSDSFGLHGYFARILIAPVSYTWENVVVELIVIAERLGAITYIGASAGTTLARALAGHNPEGTINFNISSDHVRLCYSYAKVYDSATNTERLEPLSQRAAGLRAGVDLDKGYWQSSFNQEILRITGAERQLSAMIDDPQSKVNLLNEQRITAVFSSCDSGPHLWGNRMAAWPAITHMRNFEDVRRTGDAINESIRYFNRQYTDIPITQALIDALTKSVNTYGRETTGDSAVSGFRCWFDPARNPGARLAAEHSLLNYKYMPPPPLERLTFETGITSEHPLTLEGGN